MRNNGAERFPEEVEGQLEANRRPLEELRGTAEVVLERVVEDGTITTAAGVTASIDLGLHLLRKHFGPELAREVAERIELPGYEKA